MHQSSETDMSTQGSPEISTAATTTSASPPDEVSSPPLRRSQRIRAPPDRIDLNNSYFQQRGEKCGIIMLCYVITVMLFVVNLIL